MYVVRVVPPAAGGAPDSAWIEPDPVRVVVRSGTAADAGTLYLVESFTGSNAASACFSGADCQGGTCVDFQCQGGAPVLSPPVAPFTMPYCAQDSACNSTPGQPCGPGRKGICLADCSRVAPGSMTPPVFCYPDATTRECTPDGIVTSYGVFGSCP